MKRFLTKFRNKVKNSLSKLIYLHKTATIPRQSVRKVTNIPQNLSTAKKLSKIFLSRFFFDNFIFFFFSKQHLRFLKEYERRQHCRDEFQVWSLFSKFSYHFLCHNSAPSSLKTFFIFWYSLNYNLYDNLKFIIIIVKLMIKICICHAYTVDLHLFHYPQKYKHLCIYHPSTLPPKLINFLSRSSYFSIDIIKVSFVTKKNRREEMHIVVPQYRMNYDDTGSQPQKNFSSQKKIHWFLN